MLSIVMFTVLVVAFVGSLGYALTKFSREAKAEHERQCLAAKNSSVYVPRATWDRFGPTY